MANGYVRRSDTERDSLIYTNQIGCADLDCLDDLFHCPTLFQQFIFKKCDVRITIVDNDIHAVALTAQDAHGGQRCDIRRNNMSDVAYERITLPDTVGLALLEIMKHYDLRFAAIDMVVSAAHEWYFLEINPNGQWAWLDINGVQNIGNSFLNSFSEGKVA
jgi:glutathione synthase/RimK-type ligase-like ATP-grasp enzyme